MRIDVHGRDEQSLGDTWTHGPRTLLGVQVAGFPNLFMVSGPGSPSVLANMVTGAEYHIEWIADCIEYLTTQGLKPSNLPSTLKTNGLIT